jgi:AcrR family transcriptional regulator
VTLSAKGTRLNRRGLETRRTLLTVAIRCLAEGGPESASANLVAQHAGVTWGTVQHQFGDVDGLWAAVLDHIAEDAGTIVPVLPEPSTLDDRVRAIVDQLWHSLDSLGPRAIDSLRQALPRHRSELEAEFPRTAKALAAWDSGWTAACEAAFEGITVDKVKLRRVRALLPGAMRGLHGERHLGTYMDLDEARRGLAEAITAYLS